MFARFTKYRDNLLSVTSIICRILYLRNQTDFFYLKIITNDLEKEDIKQLFMKLVFFLEYPHVTFYTTNQTDNLLHYQLISYTKKNFGFVLDVEFF